MPTMAELLQMNPYGWGPQAPALPGSPYGPEMADPQEAMSPGMAALEMLRRRAPQEVTPENAATVALSALPMGRAASLAVKPTLAGMLLGATATPAGSDEPTALKQLYQEQAKASKRRDAAIARREAERASGEGPRFTAADDEVAAASNELEAINKLIAEENKKNDPEYKLQMEKKAGEQAANTSVRESMPWLPVALAVGGATLGAGVGALTKGRAVSAFSKELSDLSDGWKTAVDGAKRALAKGNKKTARQLSEEANKFQSQYDALRKKGAGGDWKAFGYGAAAGDLGMVGPEIIDIAGSEAGSKRREEAISNLTDPVKMGTRLAAGAVLGGGPAHLAGGYMARIPYAEGFGPATSSMAKMLKTGAYEVPSSIGGGQRSARALMRTGNTPQSSPQVPSQYPGGLAGALQSESAATPRLLPSPGGTGQVSQRMLEPPSPNAPSVSTKPVVGGSSPDHNWDAKSGRWKDVYGRYLTGPPPKDVD